MAKRLEIVLALVADGVVKGAKAAEKAVDGLGTGLNSIGTKATAALNKAGVAMRDFENKTEGARRAAAGLATAGAGMAAAGAGILYGLGRASEAGRAFEERMSSIKAVSGATAAQMEQIEKTALQLGKTTVFTANEAGQALEELVKGGLSVERALEAVPETLNLAAAGGLELGKAAEITSDALNVFAKTGATAERVANALAGAANSSSTTVDSMAMALKQASASAAQMGLSVEETAAALAILANNGIKGSDAGTSLRVMLSRLAAPTKEASDAMRELGLVTGGASDDVEFFAKELSKAEKELVDQENKLTTLQERFAAGTITQKAFAKASKNISIEIAGLTEKVEVTKEELAKAEAQTTKVQSAFFNADGTAKSFSEQLHILNEATKNLTQEQRFQYLQTIFGQDAMRAAMVLTTAEMDAAKNSADGLGGAIEQMAARMANVTAADVAAEKLNNLNGDLRLLASAMEGVLVAAFNSVSDSLRTVVQWFTSVVAAVAQWIEQHPILTEWIIKATAALGILLVTLGSISLALAALIAGPLSIAGLVVALQAVGVVSTVALAPLLIVLAKVALAIAAVGVVLSTISKLMTETGTTWGDVWERMKGAFFTAWDPILATLNLFPATAKAIWQLITGDWNGALITMGEAFQNWYDKVMGSLMKVADFFTGLWGSIKAAAGDETALDAGGVRAVEGSRMWGTTRLAEERAKRAAAFGASSSSTAASQPLTSGATNVLNFTAVNNMTPMQTASAVARQVQLMTGGL